MRNLIQRTITGALFVGVLLAGMFVDKWLFFAVFLIAMLATLYEYLRLFKQDNKFHTTEFALLLGGALFYNAFFLTHFNGMSAEVWFSVLLPLIIYTGAIIFRPIPDKNNLLKSAMGLLYVVMPFVLMQYVVFYEGGFNGILLFLIFVFIWANDSFAYLFGVSFGKHRIWPEVSPKKSWEGSIGGFIMVMLICAAFWKWAGFDFSFITWIGFGAVVVISATLGDFFESYLKRIAGVKDSGSILPGHGGFYDRFDSTLFAVPASVVYLHLVQII